MDEARGAVALCGDGRVRQVFGGIEKVETGEDIFYEGGALHVGELADDGAIRDGMRPSKKPCVDPLAGAQGVETHQSSLLVDDAEGTGRVLHAKVVQLLAQEHRHFGDVAALAHGGHFGSQPVHGLLDLQVPIVALQPLEVEEAGKAQAQGLGKGFEDFQVFGGELAAGDSGAAWNCASTMRPWGRWAAISTHAWTGVAGLPSPASPARHMRIVRSTYAGTSSFVNWRTPVNSVWYSFQIRRGIRL